MQKTMYWLLLCFPLWAAAQETQDTLQEVRIDVAGKGLKKSQRTTANVVTLTSRELLKAACCNLAESFETNPSIDVNFPDALSGTRQIRMLGLTSPYLMITEENIPSVRGASQAYGLSFTPGTWVESIQVTKGAGSVVNGYESISGQINTELLKPVNDIPFFLNMYGSADGRVEANVHFNRKFSPKWSSSLFVHTNARLAKNDMNEDGFLDNPLARQVNLMNRWQYQNSEKGWVGFITARYLDDHKQSGQVDFDPDRDRGTTHFWGSEIQTRRFDLSTKIGYVFPDMPFQSIGFQNAFNTHDQQSYFGLGKYNIRQDSYYSNLIFNSIIGDTRHKFATGLNFAYDRYREYVAVPGIDAPFDRIDNSVGAYFEYTFDNNDNFSAVAGLRLDEHNRLGAFLTPRLHVRYNPWTKGVLRFSAGRGKRAASIFAENQSLFASARTFSILDNQGKVYGLDPEIAWNYGLGFSQQFFLFGQSADAGFDVYRTDFSNQAIADVYSVGQVQFYGAKSVANSLQVELNGGFSPRLHWRSAYKFYDLGTDYRTGRTERPLQARHRFFGNLAYETRTTAKGSQWKFDYTLNWSGAQRLPATGTDGFGAFSPAFSVMNTQLTRVFSKSFEVYAGAENLANYTQDRAIVGASDPFGSNFDATVVYAPVFGRMLYAGLRFKINPKK